MESLEIIGIPALLLLLTALLKLFVGREHNPAKLIESIAELPVDITFLSVSFTATYLITTASENRVYGFCCCVVGLLLSVIVIVLWRLSQKALDINKTRFIIILLINCTISLFALERSTQLIIKDNLISTQQ